MKALFTVFFLLFIPQTSLLAEGIGSTKALTITTSSGKTFLPRLSSNMTDANIDMAVQALVVATTELQADIINYAEEERRLLSDIRFYNTKNKEEANELSKILDEQENVIIAYQADLSRLEKEIDEFLARPVSKQDKETQKTLSNKLSKIKQVEKDIVYSSQEILAMRRNFEDSTSRHKKSLEAKILRWLEGNSIKLKLAEKQAREVIEYSGRLSNILSIRLQERKKIDTSAKRVIS